MDGFAGQEVNILSPAGDRLGIAKGVDESGNLQLEVDGKIELINSGEVSLRRAAGAV
jgi:biotin-(acetyl-CoA carboxylase) ligase